MLDREHYPLGSTVFAKLMSMKRYKIMKPKIKIEVI